MMCAVHSQDDIRTKAIRLVANKLYLLSYISEIFSNMQQICCCQLLISIFQIQSSHNLVPVIKD
ncbi:hypothetical protein CK203_092252 [Vitis vinifera]|uniref:Uncharacterized protein n=1 Tax=Vitis vinifera TaxID=29760 RepID=A0A438F8E5_VITVI|nr:hypothetical protein CK203_092252 [Vitis vinifera]